MADFVEVGKTNPPPIDLTQEGVYQGLISQGAEIVLFRNGIDENRGQVYIDGLTSVDVSITQRQEADDSKKVTITHFTVPLEDARRIVAIRDELRGIAKN